MSFGVVPGVGEPVIHQPFLMATALNYLAVLMPQPVAIEMSVMAIPHLAFIAWLVAAIVHAQTARD